MQKAIEFIHAGVCEVNVEQIVKKWNLCCRIYNINETYTLVEYTPKGKRKIKVTISKEDALKIIKELHLRGIESEIFGNSITYLTIK